MQKKKEESILWDVHIALLQFGLTPLMMATMQNHTETANALVEAGADVNLQSNDVSSIGAYVLGSVFNLN